MKRYFGLILAVCVLLGSMSTVLSDEGYLLLQNGDSGEAVLALEQRLKALGYGIQEADDFFDDETAAAVMQFQTANGLLATGIADQTTQSVLFSDHAVPYEADDEILLEIDEIMDDGGYTVSGISLYAAPAESASASKAAPFATMGHVPGFNRDSYAMIHENGFVSTAASPLSTFAADVDTSSYAQVRSRILRGEEVPADSVRTEEMLNYFRYSGNRPVGDEPFGVTLELTECPWNKETRLLRVLLNAREVSEEERTPRHLVFLIDTSGSMYGPDRLDLVKRAFLMLLETMGAQDHVSIVTYASSEATLAEYIPASEKTRLMEAISGLEANGYTHGSAGFIRAYEIADKYMNAEENTRILLATDGDLNVGVTSEGELARLVMDKKKSGTTLTVLGFGYGNYQDDRLQALANYGDGNCYYIDTIYEARKALVSEAGGTFDPVASDVKIQMDFNPAKVRGYRLIGYENKLLDAEDFANDEKDGGDIGSGQQMTALYEIVPAGSEFHFGAVESRYSVAAPSGADEWLTLDIRAKVPGHTDSRLFSYPLTGSVSPSLSDDMRFAAAVAETAMCLRSSEHRGTADYTSALELLRDSHPNGDPYREEFLYLVTLLERKEK